LRSHSLLLYLITSSPSALSTLSLHDALPICPGDGPPDVSAIVGCGPEQSTGHDRIRVLRTDAARRFRSHPHRGGGRPRHGPDRRDRKSTRLNSSHDSISYAVFCLKKKKQQQS